MGIGGRGLGTKLAGKGPGGGGAPSPRRVPVGAEPPALPVPGPRGLCPAGGGQRPRLEAGSRWARLAAQGQGQSPLPPPDS